MDFYKDFPERSDAGTATTPDGAVVAGNDKLNDNDYTLVGANSTGSNSQGKGYKVKFSSIYNYLKGKLLGDSGMEATSERRGMLSVADKAKLDNPEFRLIASGTLDANNCTRRGVYIPNSSSLNVPIKGNSATLMFLPGSDGRYGCQLFFNSDGMWIRSYYNSVFRNWGTVAQAPSALAASYIAERYSIDEEQALTRRMIANDPTVVEQFEAYNAYCEECKTKAKEELANQPQVLSDAE